MGFEFSAEFIIHLAENNNTFEKFKKVLEENGAEFSDSFMENLLRIIQHMKPAPASQINLSIKYPCLAIPNELPKVELPENKNKNNDDDFLNEAMASFEASAPSGKQSLIEKSKKKRRSRSGSRDRKRKKSRSTSRTRSRRRSHSSSRSRRRSKSKDRDTRNRRKHRSRDRKRSRSRSRSKSRTRKSKKDYRKDSKRSNRDFERSRSRSTEEVSMDPEVGKIYPGKVANIVAFGCFVQLESLRRRWEGLVHISQLRREGRVATAADVVSRGQKVLVKVLSISGQKISLTMKDVDQETGRDLNPLVNITRTEEDEKHLRNPDRPTSLLDLQANNDEDENYSRKRVQRLSSPEKWEIKQMLAANCIDR